VIHLENIFLYIAVGLFFFVPILVYRKGLKDGIELAKSMNTTEVPVRKVSEPVNEKNPTNEEEKQVDPFLVGFQNILSYDGSPQKEANS
jgi:hypothetical protein